MKSYFFKQTFISFLMLTLLCMGASAKTYQANWQSLDTRPCPPWFDDAKLGIFIHWGVYSVPSWAPKGQYAEWYGNTMHVKDSPTSKFHASRFGNNFKYERFAENFDAEFFDANEWAKLFKKSGAKYVVLTSKHHDGFCLWPSKQSPEWNSVDAGPKINIAKKLSAAVREQGLKMGYYYSLYEWHSQLYKKDVKQYVSQHMLPQLTDLVENYKPDLIFADGEWDHNSDVWQSENFLAWLFNESPVKDDVVVNDRWGKDCRSNHGGYYTREYGEVDVHGTSLGANKKWEENRGMGASFGYNRNENIYDYKSSKELIDMFIETVSKGGNLCLNVGPRADGIIPVIMQQRLIDMGRWLEVNGEAIYGTRPLESKSMQEHIYYTQKDDDIYVITTKWPDKNLTLDSLKIYSNSTITLLGTNIKLKWKSVNGSIEINTSDITPSMIPCEYAYTFKISLANKTN
jgi:alpha-L-fucosidase